MKRVYACFRVASFVLLALLPPLTATAQSTSDNALGREPSPDSFCGMSPSDWCTAPAGDPCGKHKDVDSCKQDSKCEGMPYRGESVVICLTDNRCFGTNCPTVGCISRCEKLSPKQCLEQNQRCVLVEQVCKRKTACGQFRQPLPEESQQHLPWSYIKK